MAVTFDALGAGSHVTSTPLTWNHTCGASANYLIVVIAVDAASSDATATATATYNSVSMSSLQVWHSGGAGQAHGYVQMFGLASPATGSALQVSVSIGGAGTWDNAAGNSMSFIGVTAIGTPATGDGVVSSTSGSVTVPSTTSGNLIAVGVCNGSGGLAFTNGTSEWVNLDGGGTGGAAGFCSGAYNTSTGSGVTTNFTQTADFYGAVAVELLATAPASAGPALPSLSMGRRPVIVVSNAGWRTGQHSR